MKLNFILVCFVALILSSLLLSSNVVAFANDSLTLDTELQDASSMTWPLLPGESINDIARLFYPKNKFMQRQFVFKTLRLSANIRPHLNADVRFKTPIILVIPTLKSLSNVTHAIKAGRNKSSKQKLHLSYNLQQAIEVIPASMMRDYEELVTKNEFLKQQLAKLNEKIILLQSKLDNLKLIFDKTFNSSSHTVPANDSTDNAIKNPPSKKVFKNLNASPNASTSAIASPAVANTETAQKTSSLLDYLNTDLVKAALALGLLLILSTFLLQKYREHMFAKLSFVASRMQTTVLDMGGLIHNRLETKQETQNSVLQAQVAKKEGERLDSTLEEARLLMSINRSSDAIVHLKMTIESQPKASINHWLYLLEIFRKLNLKEDFENYATELHNTFNVMTPIWYETEVAIYVPQNLEEFPHIMEKLYSVWPGDSAIAYLRGLITDNRGGERSGFGKEVLSEILMLIAVLDMRKELN